VSVLSSPLRPGIFIRGARRTLMRQRGSRKSHSDFKLGCVYSRVLLDIHQSFLTNVSNLGTKIPLLT